MMKPGETHWLSKKWPTSLSIRRAVLRGFEHSTPFSLQSLSKNDLDSSVWSYVLSGILIPRASSSPCIIGILRNGGVKSIS